MLRLLDSFDEIQPKYRGVSKRLDLRRPS
jgi:hypothetical protein